MEPFTGSEIIEKRNLLNEVRGMNMNILEMRLFTLYLAKINARDPATRCVRFPLADFKRILGLEKKHFTTTELQAHTNRLLQNVVNVPNNKGGYNGYVLFAACEVSQDERGAWYVELAANEKAIHLFFDFKREYFKYQLWNALRLSSVSQIRMYEILKQYEKAGRRKLDLDALKELMGIEKELYPRFDNFKSRVLEPCKNALAQHTDLAFDYEPIRHGHKITEILFTIRHNTPDGQMSLAEESPELAELFARTSAEEIATEAAADALYIRNNGLFPESERAQADDDARELMLSSERDAEEEAERRQARLERLQMLAGAVNYEFDLDQMQLLVQVLAARGITSRDEVHRFEFLALQYAEVNASKSIPKDDKARRFGLLKWRCENAKI